MRKTIRRSVVRTYVAIAAGQHKRESRQRCVTSTVATEIIEKEEWGPSKVSMACSAVTLGLHLAVQYPVLRMWHRDKLLRVGRSLCFKVMDAYITNADQDNGMIPAVASYIRDTLKKQHETFVENELDKVVDLDDRLDEDEIEYMIAMVSILKELTRKKMDITVDAVSAEARKRLIRFAQENVTLEFENGGGLRQVEYREDQSRFCIRNIETDEVVVENKRDLKRDSEKAVTTVAGTPEGQSLKIGGISKLTEVFVIKEKEVQTVSTKKDVPEEWRPMNRISDIDQLSTDYTARVWYMILNHSLPDKYSFHSGPHTWAFRPSIAAHQPANLIHIDMEISSSEMKCSPLQIQTSEDLKGKEWVHPIGTTLKPSWNGTITLKWGCGTKFETL